MSKHIFITGTNTDVGKTYIGVRLIKELSKFGFVAFKPIETGCRKKNKILIPSDSSKYFPTASFIKLAVFGVNSEGLTINLLPAASTDAVG